MHRVWGRSREPRAATMVKEPPEAPWIRGTRAASHGTMQTFRQGERRGHGCRLPGTQQLPDAVDKHSGTERLGHVIRRA